MANDGKKITSDFFQQRLEKMDSGAGDEEVFQGLDPEDASVVWMMRKLHYGDNRKLGDFSLEEQVDCFARNTRAMVNLVYESERRKVPQGITASAELVVDAIVLQHLLATTEGLPPAATALLAAIGARAEEALRHYIEGEIRFMGLPPAICQILEAKMDPTLPGVIFSDPEAGE